MDHGLCVNDKQLENLYPKPKDHVERNEIVSRRFWREKFLDDEISLSLNLVPEVT